ncbi:MAG: signal peptidase I [Clostridia bacterium]|nr:signal peptidase I [Clostridia bacterium]
MQAENLLQKRQIKTAHEIQRFFIRCLVLFVMVYVLFQFIVGLIAAPNQDMFPRISQGDLLLYYRLPEQIQVNEVVVFTKNETNYIGRVIACPGDVCEISDGRKVQVNGNTILEPDIFYETSVYEGFIQYPLTLKANEYFILADKREGGEDSRYFGPVRRESIAGIVITVFRRNNI